MTLKKAATTAAILAAGASTAVAGGLDRSTFSSNILFEEGTYTEIALGYTDPDVSVTGSGVSVAKNFRTVKAGVKFDFSKKLSFAITSNTQPLGADIDYSGAPLAAGTAASPIGVVDATDVIFLAKYKITDNISVYGGAKRQRVSASATLPNGAALSFDKNVGTGFIGGVAYEKPEIALRVALSVESKIDYTLTTRLAANGAAIGTTIAGAPKAFTLEFQSGIAKNTLIFGSIRHAKASDTNIVLNIPGGPIPLTSFDDTNDYTLGVARKFSDKIVGLVSFTYQPSEGTVSGAFAPTDGIRGITVGGQYSFGNGLKIGASISHSNRGDTITNLGQAFSDSTVTTYGIKLSKTF